MEHHISGTRRRMSGVERAAQFAPFAALSGYAEGIDAARVIPCAEQIPDEVQNAELNAAIARLDELPRDERAVEMTRVVRSETYGAACSTQRVEVRSVDTAGRVLVLTRGETVQLDDICALRILKDAGEAD